MHQSQSGFSIFIFLGLFLAALTSCKDIPRDNVFDPKNPQSYRARMILLEAFVNTANDQNYNEYMISALKMIGDRYPGKVIIAQFHRNTFSYSDSLAIPENETLYEKYINYFDNLKGVPDVFINGSQNRVKGASSVTSAVDRLDEAIQSLLIENSFFTIEPDVRKINSKISISAKIARLGAASIADIFITAIVTEEIDSGTYTRVVRNMESSNLIPRLQPGEQKEIKFSDVMIQPDAKMQVIFNIKTTQNLIVHQSIEVAVS